MAQAPLTQEGFDNAVAQLRLWTAELSAVIDAVFPAGTIYKPESWPAGSGWDGPSGVIRKRIGEVIEAFSALQEALGLPAGELSMRQQRIADRDQAAANPWPTVGSIRGEIVEAMAQIVHDEKAKVRDRQAAARIVLEASHQDRMARALADIDEANRTLARRLDALEQRAAEFNIQESLIMAKKTGSKSRRTKSAPAPSKSPSVLKRDDAPPSKQKPRHGGGAGYSSFGRHG